MSDKILVSFGLMHALLIQFYFTSEVFLITISDITVLDRCVFDLPIVVVDDEFL